MRDPAPRPGSDADRDPVAVRLVVLPAGALEALIDGDLERAGAAAGVALPPTFLANRWLWTLRLGQLVGEPSCAPWLVRAVVPSGAAVAVGHAGFHGPPDGRGVVEAGYEIVPEHRRRGFASASLTELLRFARAHGATGARLSIGPGNTASLALARSFGFVHVGEQMDPIDGRELVFERSLT